MKVLVTGAAGFIGMHVAKALLERGDEVLGLDNLNDYYDPALKLARLEQLKPYKGFCFIKGDVADAECVNSLFKTHEPDAVVHLAAQAGVRYSIENPAAYVQSNLVGFGHMLEACRHHQVRHLVYASSSSVYGANSKMPFSVADPVDHPISLYAATKKANELMAHSYSHLFGLPTTGLRFFTVYGPWGRPDMALFKFTHAIFKGERIPVYNYGKHRRDFTYIDDIVEGVVRVLDAPATPAPNAGSTAPWRVYNIGNNKPVELLDYIKAIESAAGKAADMELLPMQPGDVPDTFADIDDLVKQFGYQPSTPVEQGVQAFVRWYQHFYATQLAAA